MWGCCLVTKPCLLLLLLLLLLSRFSHVQLCVTPQTAAYQAPRPWDSPGKNTRAGCHFLLQCMKVKSESEVTQSCPTLRNPMDCSLPRLLRPRDFPCKSTCMEKEWVAIAFSKSCLTLCKLMDYSTPGFLSFTVSQNLLKLMSVELVMPSKQLILCGPLLLLPSIYPSIRIFSNELFLCIRQEGTNAGYLKCI